MVGRQKAYKKCRCSSQGKHAPSLPKGLKSVGLKARAKALLEEENCQTSCLCWLLSLTWLQINGKTQRRQRRRQRQWRRQRQRSVASWGILIFHAFFQDERASPATRRCSLPLGRRQVETFPLPPPLENCMNIKLAGKVLISRRHAARCMLQDAT